MIGAAPRRVAAVIGRQQQEVAGAQARNGLRQAAIEGSRARPRSRQCRGGGQTACRNRRSWRRRGRRRRRHPWRRAPRRTAPCCRRPCAPRIRPDGQRCRRSCRCRSPCCSRAVSRSSSVGSGGGTAKSRRLAVRSKRGGGLADERPGDHPADVQRIDQLARQLAELVEPLEAEMPFMRGDLDNGIRRRVADRLAGPDMLLAEPVDDLGARGMAVAENAGQRLPRRSSPRVSAGGKARHGLREIAPFERHRNARRSPSGRTACPCRSKLSCAAPWKDETRSVRRPFPKQNPLAVFAALAKAERQQVRDIERAFAKALRDRRRRPHRLRRCGRTCSSRRRRTAPHRPHRRRRRNPGRTGRRGASKKSGPFVARRSCQT